MQREQVGKAVEEKKGNPFPFGFPVVYSSHELRNPFQRLYQRAFRAFPAIYPPVDHQRLHQGGPGHCSLHGASAGLCPAFGPGAESAGCHRCLHQRPLLSVRPPSRHPWHGAGSRSWFPGPHGHLRGGQRRERAAPGDSQLRRCPHPAEGRGGAESRCGHQAAGCGGRHHHHQRRHHPPGLRRQGRRGHHHDRTGTRYPGGPSPRHHRNHLLPRRGDGPRHGLCSSGMAYRQAVLHLRRQHRRRD